MFCLVLTEFSSVSDFDLIFSSFLRCPYGSSSYAENPHLNVEIKKGIDLKSLPKASSSDLLTQFHNLMHDLYFLKTDEQRYETPNCEKAIPLSHTRYYYPDDLHHKLTVPTKHYVNHDYHETPKYEVEYKVKDDPYYHRVDTSYVKPSYEKVEYSTPKPTTKAPYVPPKTTPKAPYVPVEYKPREDPYYPHEDKSYSYVKSNYEERDYVYPVPKTTTKAPYVPPKTTPKAPYVPPYYPHEDKSYSYVKSNYEERDYEYTPKPYYPPRATTTTRKPYVEPKHDYEPPQRYSFEVSYEDHESYPEDHYVKHTDPYALPEPYKPHYTPRVTTPKPYTSTVKYSTPKPYKPHSAVKSEVYPKDHDEPSYPEPYYDFVKYLEKDYTQKYLPDMADYYHQNQQYKSPSQKQLEQVPCDKYDNKEEAYELPLLYNPNTYDSLKRPNSPVHDTTALLKHFDRKHLYLLDEEHHHGCKDKQHAHYHDDDYYTSDISLTKRKTAGGSDDSQFKHPSKNGVRKQKLPDWEETKAITGNGELYSYVVETTEKPTKAFELEVPESHAKVDDEDFGEPGKNGKMFEQIWSELDKIQRELQRRKVLEALNENEMSNDVNRFRPETIETTDEDIQKRHKRGCKY